MRHTLPEDENRMVVLMSGSEDDGKTAAEAAPLGALEMLDRLIMLFLYSRFRNPVFDLLMPILSRIADRGILHFIVGGLMLLFGGPMVKRAALVMLASAGAAGFLTEMPIKFIWKRKRPFMVMESIMPTIPHKRLYRRPSFPSGHSAGYFGAAAGLTVCFPQWSPLFLICAALGAFSRIYNGVHFPSDVAAGSIIGVVFGFGVALGVHPLTNALF